MARWSFKASDLSTGAATGDLALQRWEHEDLLDDAGQFNMVLASQGTVIDRNAIDITLPAHSVITPIRNGRLLGYAGIVWRSDPPNLAGASLLSYFDTQAYSATTTFTNVDQHTILKTLVDWVQGTAVGGNIRVDTSQVEASGVLRDQTWNIWEAKNVGEALRQKGDNIGGFDFDFRVEDDMVRRMRMWTPRRGRIYQAQASPVFTVGRNARTVPQAPADGAGMATVVVALGEEINSTTHERLVATSTRTDLIAQGYPRLVKVLDLQDIKDLTTLQAHADGYAANYGATVIDVIVLEVDPNDVTWPWGSWDLGDDCQVVIPTPRPAEYTIVPPVSAHFLLPGVIGNYLSTPDTADLDITGDIEIVARVSQSDWYTTPAAFQGFVAKADGPSGSGRSYILRRSGAVGSQLQFLWSANGAALNTSSWTYPAGWGNDAAIWIRVRFVVSTGDASWDYSTEDTNIEPSSWTTGATTTFGATSIFAGSFPVVLGSDATASRASTGRIHRAIIRNGIAGTVVFDVSGDNIVDTAASQVTATTGQIVTVARAGSPSTQLVAAVPGYRITTDAGEAGDPWWPTGLNQTRRIVGHRWTVEGATERLEVITGRLFGT